MATLSNTSFFSPTQISGCSLWLDAADSNSVVLSGGNVSVWRDKSGNTGRDAVPSTGSGGTYPSNRINGLATVGMTISGNMRAPVPAQTFPTELSAFVVFMKTGTNTKDTVIFRSPVINDDARCSPFLPYTGTRVIGNGTTFAYTNGATNPFSNVVPTLYNFNISSNANTTWNEWINGSGFTYNLAAGTPGYGDTSTQVWLGAGTNVANPTMAGVIAEVIMYNRTPSTAQRQQIEGYLAWKWGLQSNLPSTHPFYNYNPNVPNINLFTPTTVITSPLQVSGCSLWLDAGDSATVIRTGNTVTQWNNKVTGTTGAATIDGTLTYGATSGPKSLPTINTTAGGIYMAPLTPLTNSVHTTFFIMNMTSVPADGRIMLSYAQSSGILAMRPIDHAFNTFRNLVRYPNNASATAPSFLNTFFMGTSYLTTSVIGLLINGGQQSATTSITTNPGTVTGFGVGYSHEFSAYTAFPGNMSEVITYSRALSTAQRQQVEGYLAWKWGLQSSLPTTHPFYNFNPSAPLLIQQATLPIVQSNTTLITMNPTQISGCALWLDAADANSIVLSGSNVSQWKDKSGNSRDTTATALTSTYNTNVLNGLNGIVITSNTPPAFTTSSSSPFVLSATSQISAFIILNFSSQTNYIDFMAAFPNRNNFMMGTDGAPIYPYNTYINNVNNYFSYNFPVNTTRIVELVYNGVSPALTSYINGSQIGVTTTPSPGTSLTTSQRIQVFNPNGVMTMTGQVFELLFYSRNLSTSERQQIEGYLAWKWGLQANLPTSHPYYYNPLIPNLVLQSQLLSMTPSFSPLRFSGTSLWLDAADPASVITSGNLVTQWNDKSGNGTNATTTAASNFPQYSQSSLNNLGTLRFNGASGTPNFLDTPAFDFGTSTRTVFFVMRNTGPLSGTASSPHWFWSKTGNGTNALAIVGWMQFRANATDIMYDATRNTYLLICFRFGTTTGFEELFNNGTLVASATKSSGGTSYANATAGYRLGWLTSDPTLLYYFDGNIAEVLLYKTAVTNSQRQQIEGYLAWKWGLQSSLPANHPYVLFPPS